MILDIDLDEAVLRKAVKGKLVDMLSSSYHGDPVASAMIVDRLKSAISNDEFGVMVDRIISEELPLALRSVLKDLIAREVKRTVRKMVRQGELPMGPK